MTDLQARVLGFIQSCVRRTGRGPTYRAIARHLGVTVRSAYQHVLALERKGILSRGGRRQGIRLSPEFVPPAGLPVLGQVAAGVPLLSPQNVDEYLDVEALFRREDAVFLLKVSGDSMVDRGILPGDFVLVEQRETLSNGQVAAVLVDGEATVKTVREDRQGLLLVPENAKRAYKPIRVAKDRVRILGRVLVSFRLLTRRG